MGLALMEDNLELNIKNHWLLARSHFPAGGGEHLNLCMCMCFKSNAKEPKSEFIINILKKFSYSDFI